MGRKARNLTAIWMKRQHPCTKLCNTVSRRSLVASVRLVRVPLDAVEGRLRRRRAARCHLLLRLRGESRLEVSCAADMVTCTDPSDQHSDRAPKNHNMGLRAFSV